MSLEDGAIASEASRHETRLRLAQDVTTSGEILMALAGDEKASVRQMVASNPSTPAGVLVQLAGDGDFLVPQIVLANPSATPAAFRAVAAKEPTWVAAHRNTPVEILQELLAGGNSAVRSALARNERAPEEFLTDLAT